LLFQNIYLHATEKC